MNEVSTRASVGGQTSGGPVRRDQFDDALPAAAYRLLLQRPGLDLDQFAIELRCSPGEVRRVLDRLAELALLQRRPCEYGSFVAVSPIAAVQRLISDEQELLHKRHRFLQQGYETISAVLRDYAMGARIRDSGQDFEYLTDLASVRRRLEELALYARHRVCTFSPPAADPTATRTASRPLDLSALARGVRVQRLYLDRTSVDPEALRYAEEIADAGAEVRLVPDLPLRMIVVDDRTAVLPRNPADDTEGALLVLQPGIVAAAGALFDAYWGRGCPLATTHAATVNRTSPLEHAVLSMLATGVKDETVARTLHTSVRTIRRVIADLMDRAGVTSRFALGAYASDHDWL